MILERTRAPFRLLHSREEPFNARRCGQNCHFLSIIADETISTTGPPNYVYSYMIRENQHPREPNSDHNGPMAMKCSRRMMRSPLDVIYSKTLLDYHGLPQPRIMATPSNHCGGLDRPHTFRIRALLAKFHSPQ